MMGANWWVWVRSHELQRLRAVETVARELAAIIRENLYDGSHRYRCPGVYAERADQALTRAAELGLLAEEGTGQRDAEK